MMEGNHPSVRSPPEIGPAGIPGHRGDLSPQNVLVFCLTGRRNWIAYTCRRVAPASASSSLLESTSIQTMKTQLAMLLAGAMLVATAYSGSEKSDLDLLQGKWRGTEAGE